MMLGYLVLHQIYISCDAAVPKFRNPNILPWFSMAWDFRCPNFGIPNVFRDLLLPTFWVSEFRKPKYFRPKFPFSVILSQLSIAKILGVRISETQMCFRNFLLPIFWVSEFRKPKFQTKSLSHALLLLPYSTYNEAIRISSTVSRNFGRIVRKSKKFHTNNPNIVKTCRNWIGEISSPHKSFFIAVDLHHKSEQNRIFFLNVRKFKLNSAS